MKDRTLNEENPEDIAWELFRRTGDIGYYELYKRLKR